MILSYGIAKLYGHSNSREFARKTQRQQNCSLTIRVNRTISLDSEVVKRRRLIKKQCKHEEVGRANSAYDSASVERASQLFRTMGDAPRSAVLEMFSQREWCVSEIVAAMGEKFSTVSQRLRVCHRGPDRSPP